MEWSKAPEGVKKACGSILAESILETQKEILKEIQSSCKNGHGWMHLPLSDVVDCWRCGEIKKENS